MTDHLMYSRNQWIRAVNSAALIGWACVSVPTAILVGPVVLLYATVFGLPIAFLCCWVIAAPILKRLMRREITMGRAAFWGGLIAFLMSLLSLAVERYQGWQTSFDPSRASNFSGGTSWIDGQFVVTEVHGMLTAYGWLMAAQSTLIFVAMGVFVAVVVRLLIGEPTGNSRDC